MSKIFSCFNLNCCVWATVKIKSRCISHFPKQHFDFFFLFFQVMWEITWLAWLTSLHGSDTISPGCYGIRSRPVTMVDWICWRLSSSNSFPLSHPTTMRCGKRLEEEGEPGEGGGAGEISSRRGEEMMHNNGGRRSRRRRRGGICYWKKGWWWWCLFWRFEKMEDVGLVRKRWHCLTAAKRKKKRVIFHLYKMRGEEKVEEGVAIKQCTHTHKYVLSNFL